MKVLIIGSGGREHAIADCFSKSDKVSKLLVAPGNAGIAREFECLPLKTKSEVVAWCALERPDLVFIGPEQPLAEGLADLLRAAGINCIGPTQAAARIETSKIFAKDLMKRHGIPTASYERFFTKETAGQYIRSAHKYPLVIKADGLAAGKGVVIAGDQTEALAAIESLNSATGLVVEEYLRGWELSLFAISDGTNFRTTLFSQDHKQLNDGDKGPNTGGMGAYCPIPEAEAYRPRIETGIVAPVLRALREEGCPFQGFLYCGLMITSEGPKVVEFNCRLGDPETQALLPLLDTDLIEICEAINTNAVNDLDLNWKDQSSICVVLASKGYPGSYKKGFPITIKDKLKSKAYYSGVVESAGLLITNGGRVLSLCALSDDIETAYQKVYQDIDLIDFEGKTYRRDISLRHNFMKVEDNA